MSAESDGLQSPVVSIVLPVHNGEAFLTRALDSILAQTFTDFELIAVDDCSSDASAAILADYAARHPRMRVLTLSENAKLPGALNKGFAQARADWLTWTSDDNVLHANMLQSLLDARDANPHADILYAGYRVIDDDGDTTGQVAALPGDQLLERNVVGCCFLYHRAVEETLGGYDETLFGAEDYDFWLRAARAGFVLQPLAEELYDYRRHDGSLTDRRWYENRRKVERVLEREIPFSSNRRAKARAWTTLFIEDPFAPKPRYLLQALREDPRAVLSRPLDLAVWARRAIGWRLK